MFESGVGQLYACYPESKMAFNMISKGHVQIILQQRLSSRVHAQYVNDHSTHYSTLSMWHMAVKFSKRSRHVCLHHIAACIRQLRRPADRSADSRQFEQQISLLLTHLWEHLAHLLKNLHV